MSTVYCACVHPCLCLVASVGVKSANIYYLKILIRELNRLILFLLSHINWLILTILICAKVKQNVKLNLEYV